LAAHQVITSDYTSGLYVVFIYTVSGKRCHST